MGAEHTVTAPGSLNLMRDTLTAPGNVIVERGAEPSPYSALGDAALCTNSMHKYAVPGVVRDSSAGWASSGADTYQVVARYMVPVEHMRTGLSIAGGNNAQLYCRVRIKTDNGGSNPASVRFSTAYDTAEVTGITDTSYAWNEVGAADFFDSTAVSSEDYEITIESKGATDGSAVIIESIEVSWVDTGTTLANGEGGAYESGFMPLSVAKFSEAQKGKGTEEAQRLLRNLRRLYATRCGGLIMSSYLTTATGRAVVGSESVSALWKARATQYQHFREVQVWLRGTGPLTTITIGEASATIPPGLNWQPAVITLPETSVTRRWDITVTQTSNGGAMTGCCMWWRDPGTLRR